MLTRNADPHQKRSSRAPDTIGPSAPPAPAKPTQMAIARCRSSGGNTAVINDSVAGITRAAPAPCTARPTMTNVASVGQPADEGSGAEDRQADEQCALAPEAVAERAGGQQQTGEDERVGVDDPLQRRGAGVELALQRRQGDVQRRDRHDDHDEREAQHTEEEPAPFVDFGSGVEREVGHRGLLCLAGWASNET